MANPKGVNLKDLIEAQRKLAAQGNANAEKQLKRLEDLQEQVASAAKVQADQLKQVEAKLPAPKLTESIEKLSKQDRLLQVAQLYQAREINEDDDKLVDSMEQLKEDTKAGLIDTTGNGLNANVLKLIAALQKQQGVVGQAGTSFSGNVDTNQGALFSGVEPSTVAPKPSLFEAPKKGTGLAGWRGAIADTIKKLRSPETYLDMSEGANTEGVGALLRKPIDEQRAQAEVTREREKFISDQLATGATQDRELAGKRFDKVVEQRKIIKESQQQVQEARARGLTDEQIERTGLFTKIRTADRKIAVADPLYREKVAAQKASRASALVPTTVSGAPSVVDGVDPVSETQDEVGRVLATHTKLLQKIEENTRPTNKPKADAATQSTQATPADGEQQELGLGDLVDMLPGRRTRARIAGRLARAGGGIAGAVRGTATRIGTAASGLATKAAPVGGGIRAAAIPAAAAVVAANTVDWAAGKVGVGKDDAGNDIAIDAPQDDKNWERMNWWQKAESGVGRGIEKVGSFIGFGNLAREAQASRIQAETEYLNREAAVQPTPADKKLSASDVGVASMAMTTRPEVAIPPIADYVYQQSAEVSKLINQPAPAAPVVISAPQTTNVQQTQNYLNRGEARNTESSWQSYNKSRFAF